MIKLTLRRHFILNELSSFILSGDVLTVARHKEGLNCNYYLEKMPDSVELPL